MSGAQGPFAGPTSARSAGNGTIIRLAPVPMFYSTDREKIAHLSGESSRTTHGSHECVEACRLFGLILANALDGLAKDSVLLKHGYAVDSASPVSISDLAAGAYLDKSREEICGSGYVVYSLEAALWSFNQTQSFREAILMAVNLGNDADTTASVCGQVAGAFYGASGIPDDWLKTLCMRGIIESLADCLCGAEADSS